MPADSHGASRAGRPRIGVVEGDAVRDIFRTSGTAQRQASARPVRPRRRLHPSRPARPSGDGAGGWSLLAVDRLEPCVPDLRRVLDDGLRGGAVGSATAAAVLLALGALAAVRWGGASRLAEQAQIMCASRGAMAMPGRAGAGRRLPREEVAYREHTNTMISWHPGMHGSCTATRFMQGFSPRWGRCHAQADPHIHLRAGRAGAHRLLRGALGGGQQGDGSRVTATARAAAGDRVGVTGRDRRFVGQLGVLVDHDDQRGRREGGLPQPGPVRGPTPAAALVSPPREPGAPASRAGSPPDFCISTRPLCPTRWSRRPPRGCRRARRAGHRRRADGHGPLPRPPRSSSPGPRPRRRAEAQLIQDPGRGAIS